MSNNISVVGLGKLGLPFAVCLANSGFRVIGIDIDENRVRQVNKGIPSFFEPGLAERLSESAGQSLKASSSIEKAVKESDITFFLTATPSGADGGFLTDQLEAAIKPVARNLGASRKASHLFVIGSTVMPGTINSTIIPLIERESGRQCGHGFGVCYNPEFVAIGDVIRGYLEADIVVIGESDEASGVQVENIFLQMCSSVPKIARMSIVNSEIAKVSLNAYISMKITFANQVSKLCEQVDGADIDVVTRAIGCDKRIARPYLSGGLPFGGPCFPRDIRAMELMFDQYCSGSKLFGTIRALNDERMLELAELIEHLGQETGADNILFLGVAFKPDTDVMAASPAIELAKILSHGVPQVSGFDRLVRQQRIETGGREIVMKACLEDALSESRIVVFLHNDPVLARQVERFEPGKPTLILDCWRIVDKDTLHHNFSYRCVGRNQSVHVGMAHPCQIATR